MNKREMKYLSEEIAAKERIITCYEQMVVDIREVVYGNFKQITLLHSGDDSTDEFISQFVPDIRGKIEELYKNSSTTYTVRDVNELKAEIERLKHRTLWQRIFNR